MLLVWRVGGGKNVEDAPVIDRLKSDLPVYFFGYSESLFVFEEVFLFKLKMNASVFCFPCRAMPAVWSSPPAVENQTTLSWAFQVLIVFASALLPAT